MYGGRGYSDWQMPSVNVTTETSVLSDFWCVCFTTDEYSTTNYDQIYLPDYVSAQMNEWLHDLTLNAVFEDYVSAKCQVCYTLSH